MTSSLRRAAALLLGLLLSVSAHAQTKDNPVRIVVDCRDFPKHELHATLTFSVAPGPLTLYYPKWIPGEHMVGGPIANLAGIVMTAGGQPVPWQRDTLDYFTFHCDVPQGAGSLEVKLDLLDAPASHELGSLRWNEILLYPAGAAVQQQYYTPSVLLPGGWKYATALEPASEGDGHAEFKTVTLETLVDSPLMCGSHLKRVDMGDVFGAHVEADFFCDTEEGLDFKPDFPQKLKNMAREAGALFGSRHFNHYNMLVGLSDHAGNEGIEHHQSTEIRERERILTDRSSGTARLNVFAHELGHSWCGKYRRPVGLTFTDYQKPENSELLWVYEGMEQFIGYVLDGRSGMQTPENARMQFVTTAAGMAVRPGRSWRNLRDTAISSGPLRAVRRTGTAWRRGQDYYMEGAIIWMEVDATIRKLSGGKKSIDDFCKMFFGGGNTGPEVNPYSEDVVMATLNSVQPYDWKKFFDERLDGLSTPEPTRSLEAAGWKLTYVDTSSSLGTAFEGAFGIRDLRYSLGMSLSNEGVVSDVAPGSVADKAGLSNGMTVLGINGHKYGGNLMRDALKSGKTSTEPMEILVDDGDFYKVLKVDYHGGPKYPNAERIQGTPDYLTELLKPRTSAPDGAAGSGGGAKGERRRGGRPH